ncbi:MAG: SPOR domain-containing protein [Chitinophagales bacterium]
MTIFKRSLLTAMISFFFVCSSLLGQEKTIDKTVLTYKIQIGAYKNTDNINTSKLQEIGKVHFEEAGNGIKRIVVGYYTTKNEAELVLKQIKQEGFPDAFVGTKKKSVVATTTKKEIPQSVLKITEDVKALEEEKKTESSDTQIAIFSENIKKETSSEVKTPQIETNNIIAIKKEYLVYVDSYTDMTQVPKVWFLDGLGNIFVQEENGQKKVLIGSFSDEKEAEAIKAKLINAGFEQASVRQAGKKEEQITRRNGAAINSDEEQPKVKKPSGQAAIDFAELKQLFEKTDFEIRNIDAYDPTQKAGMKETTYSADLLSKNKALEGKKIPHSLLYLLNDANIKQSVMEYYGISIFDIDSDNEAYMVRFGDGLYDKNNKILFYIYNKSEGNFVGSELLSSVLGNNTLFTKTQSWIMDLNNDNILDILSYTIEEYFTQGEHIEKGKFDAKVWLNGRYIEAQIVNEDRLKEQLGVK